MPKRHMLINYVPGEECRIAIVEDGRLEELYQERASSESHVGNIYKGKVVNVEPSIQAAFIDFGLERNGFLHISDLHPKYFPGQYKEEFERVGEKTPRRDRPPIQRCLRRGQEILVQVLKEGIGTKGPTLTSYLSIPGRFIVMMPHMEKAGVSRKVEDDEARRAMRKILDELNLPSNFGWIVRTAGKDRPKTDLKRDAAYLQRLWKTIEHRRANIGAVGELYTESDLVIRTIRDVFSTDIDRIIVDNEKAAKRAADFLAVANPRSRSNVMVYRDGVPLFHRYDIEKQIENINARTVPLPSGGSLVIDSTEALVAIDVNSGKMRDNRDAETTAYKVNMEAADEICRQLRLRDLGGVIVNDLIDMIDLKHRRTLEQRFRNNLKNDRARTRISPISQFGILEMTRQRMRPSLKNSIYVACEQCKGSGHTKSAESVVLDVMRRLALVVAFEPVTRIELTVSPDVAFQLLNRRRSQLVELEQRRGTPVMVRVNANGPIDFVSLDCYDSRGGLVPAETAVDDSGDWTSQLIDVDTLRKQERAAGIIEDEPLEHLDEEEEVEAEVEETGETEPEGPSDEQPGDGEGEQEREQAQEPAPAAPPRSEGRRGRHRRGRRGRESSPDSQESSPMAQTVEPASADTHPEAPAQAAFDAPTSDTPVPPAPRMAPVPPAPPAPRVARGSDAAMPPRPPASTVPVVWRKLDKIQSGDVDDIPAEPQPPTHESVPLARRVQQERRAAQRETALPQDEPPQAGDEPRKRRRRRGGRRRRRGGQGNGNPIPNQPGQDGAGPQDAGHADGMDDYHDDGHEPGDINGNAVEPSDEGDTPSPEGSAPPAGDPNAPAGKRRRRRRRGGRGRRRDRGANGNPEGDGGPAPAN